MKRGVYGIIKLEFYFQKQTYLDKLTQMSPNSFDGIQFRKSSARPKSFGVFAAPEQIIETSITKSVTTKTVIHHKPIISPESAESIKTARVRPLKINKTNPTKSIEQVNDPKRRAFLKLAAVAGLGVVVAAFIPQKAEALILGSSPTTGVVGVKDENDVRITPATEDTLQNLLTGQSVDKITTSLSASGNVLVPSAGMRIRVYSTRFSLTADLNSVSFRFGIAGSDYERYISPKTGGLYGANNHPNFVQGGIDEPMYCVIDGTATVQINVDYLEV